MKHLIYNKILNNINCGILLSIDKPIKFPEEYQEIRGIRIYDDENIFYSLSKIDNIRVFNIYVKNNPVHTQADNLLEYCLEEYCLQKNFRRCKLGRLTRLERLGIETKYSNISNAKGPLIVETPLLFCFGVNERKKSGDRPTNRIFYSSLSLEKR